jgi:diaminohydroxyphosphoribosylaminopyrimidine deaminase/5-amino-6-(5-phosphoribosylamino)uracil reductase
VNKSDKKYMNRALSLAKLGKGNVAPNPMVGSVVVYNNIIIGEGYHMQYGEAHAEVNAIHSVKDKNLLSKSTIYVNLEPCAHYGKTPPCSNLIIDSKIPRVVIGCIDSFSEVSGKGIKKMEKAGIEVILGVLEKESLELNKRFFTFHTHKRPFIILKWAKTTNGFMDIDRIGTEETHSIEIDKKSSHKGIFWITQPETKSLVHKWRTEEAGILVGRKTIENDNPSLTCRDYKGNNPTRIVLDKDLKADYSNYTITKDDVKTIILNQKVSKIENNIEYIKITDFSIDCILTELYYQNIQSVIIEGGLYTLNQFIEANLWDEAKVLTGINLINEGVKGPSIEGHLIESYKYGKDFIEVFGRLKRLNE